MNDNRHVRTREIQSAVRGQEVEILNALDIDCSSGQTHIACPYPAHDDEHPSWRWDAKKSCAFCSCIGKSHSIFDVVMAKEAIDFEAAKIRVAQMLGREDLIRTAAPDKSNHEYQAFDAISLLNASGEQRDDALLVAYLANRLSIPVAETPMPWTPAVGLKVLAYFDPPPEGSKAKPKLVGNFPCAVFGTVSADGRTHAHRIYVAAEGAGKADLGTGPDGRPREPKKSAKVSDGVRTSGCSVIWGDPLRASQLLLAEGIETATALASTFVVEIALLEIAVAAGISATGLEAFQPYPATQKITICADRDEADKANGGPGSRRGEKAARKFGLLNHEHLKVEIALPGKTGETMDWLDVFRAEGPEAVRAGVQAAALFLATTSELEELAGERSRAGDLQKIAEVYPLPKMDILHLRYAYTAS